MAAKKYKVGLEIEAWCTKCKVDRLHAIETLKSDGNINRVLCRTCEGVHLFRRPKGEGGAGAKKSGAKRRKKSEAAVSEAELAKAKPYAIDGEYKVGEVIQHAKFGAGRVVALKPGGKIEVAFEEASRILLCRNTGSLLLKRGRAAAAARTAAAISSAADGDDEDDGKDEGESSDDDSGDDDLGGDDAKGSDDDASGDDEEDSDDDD